MEACAWKHAEILTPKITFLKYLKEIIQIAKLLYMIIFVINTSVCTLCMFLFTDR